MSFKKVNFRALKKSSKPVSTSSWNILFEAAERDDVRVFEAVYLSCMQNQEDTKSSTSEVMEPMESKEEKEEKEMNLGAVNVKNSKMAKGNKKSKERKENKEEKEEKEEGTLSCFFECEPVENKSLLQVVSGYNSMNCFQFLRARLGIMFEVDRIDRVDSHGNSALNYACAWNAKDAVKALIELGASLKIGGTALAACCKYKSDDCLNVVV